MNHLLFVFLLARILARCTSLRWEARLTTGLHTITVIVSQSICVLINLTTQCNETARTVSICTTRIKMQLEILILTKRVVAMLVFFFFFGTIRIMFERTTWKGHPSSEVSAPIECPIRKYLNFLQFHFICNYNSYLCSWHTVDLFSIRLSRVWFINLNIRVLVVLYIYHTFDLFPWHYHFQLFCETLF